MVAQNQRIAMMNNPNSKAAYHPDFTPIDLWTKAAYNKESVNVKLVYCHSFYRTIHLRIHIHSHLECWYRSLHSCMGYLHMNWNLIQRYKENMKLLKSAWMINKQDKHQTLNNMCIFPAGVVAWVPRSIRLSINHKSRTFSLYLLDYIYICLTW